MFTPQPASPKPRTIELNVSAVCKVAFCTGVPKPVSGVIELEVVALELADTLKLRVAVLQTLESSNEHTEYTNESDPL